jgi:hypothetical protein
MKEIKYTTVSVNFCDSIFIKFRVPEPELITVPVLVPLNYGPGYGS